MREKELSIKENEQNILSPQNKFEYKEVVKKSDKPMKAQEEIINRIIHKNKGKEDKDINKLEEELLKDHSHNKSSKKEQQWKDVQMEDIMQAHESFTIDPDLSNDSKIPSNCPPLDSDLGLKSSVNDYSNHHFNKKKHSQRDYRKVSKNKNKSKGFEK